MDILVSAASPPSSVILLKIPTLSNARWISSSVSPLLARKLRFWMRVLRETFGLFRKLIAVTI